MPKGQGKRTRWTQESFISKCVDVHDGFYDYSKTVYLGTQKPVLVICPHHGEFSQQANSHLSGKGCKDCGWNSTGDTLRGNAQDFIKRASEKYGNAYDYSKVEYKTARVKVEIVCPEHGSFFYTPDEHLNSGWRGCKQCPDPREEERQRNKQEKFIGKAIKVHGDQFDYSKTFYEGNTKRTTFVCKDHGEFIALPTAHLKDSGGCKGCKKVISENRTKGGINKFLDKARETHGERYSYEDCGYVNMNTKVLITCKEHGQFRQNPSKHVHGRGCPVCAEISRQDFHRNDTDYFIEVSRHIHGDFFDYSKSVYTGGKDQIEVICPIHGSFMQNAQNHMSGKGCKGCSTDRARERYTHTQEQFLERCEEVHGDFYDYSKVEYVDSKTKVTVVCPTHGEFQQFPYNHLDGRSCKECSLDERNRTKGWLHPMYWTDKPSNIYIMRINSEDGPFIKVGLAVKIKPRHYQLTEETGVKVDVIHTFEAPANLLRTCEQQVFREFLGHRYYPEVQFSGHTECLEDHCLPEVVEYIENYLKESQNDHSSAA